MALPAFESTPIETDPGLWSAPDTVIRHEPFEFLVAHNVIDPSLHDDLWEDFPKFRGAGYLPYNPEECGPTVNALIDHLTSPAFADRMGEALGLGNLSRYPTMVSISRYLKKRHGRIHTDGQSKIATMLLYLNKDWNPREGGCLRFLKSGDDFNDTVVPEIPPVYGTLACFRRTDCSYHGHLPFQGERHVIQIAWVTDEDQKKRKQKRGRWAQKTKEVLSWFRG
ncbi:2OG-Fe(II) oxygenase [Marinobacteraceae bacterium S3BR75-40.1]